MDGNKSLMCFSLGNARDQPPDTEFPPLRFCGASFWLENRRFQREIHHQKRFIFQPAC